MNDQEILKLARAHVAPHLHSSARIVLREERPRFALASVENVRNAAEVDVDAELAAELGVAVPEDDGESADVEFSERTPLGTRSTVVHVRAGKVARVLTRG